MTDFPRTNWSKTFRYGFRESLHPSSIEELQSQVAGARRVKVLASRHSFNGIVDGECAMILADIPLEPRIEADGRVSIAGHATYGELALFLRGHGLALHNLASLPHISIAGAIATATHGSGIRNANLAAGVHALSFVAADGRLIDVRRGDADFEGMVVHLGALGVVARVTLDVQPAFQVAQTVYEGLGWDALLDDFEGVMGCGYSVSVFTNWGERAGQVWVKGLEAEPAPVALHDSVRASVKRHPLVAMDPVNVTDQLGVPGSWEDRLPHFKMGFTPSSGDEIQSEFHVPFASAAAAIRALLAIRERFAHLVQVVEFRAVAADTLWLSPQYRCDTLSIHFTWFVDGAAVDKAVISVEEALAPFDALPHWGKVFSLEHVGARYAKLADFSRLRDQLDPDRKFSNAWLEQVVFGQSG